MNQDVFLQSQNLIFKAAYLYFAENYSQTQIAKKLNISISTVSRLLKQAQKQELIQVHIDENICSAISLERALKELLPLEDIIVAPRVADYTPRDSVALECARYLQTRITPDTIMGISFGYTFKKTLEYINPCRKTNARYVMMHGILPSSEYETHLRRALYILESYMGGTSYVLTADAFISDEHVWEYAMSKKNSQEIFDLYDKLTMSIGSIGNAPITESHLITDGNIQSEELLDYVLQDPSILSEFCMRFYDQNGNECATPFSDWTMAIDSETYKRIPLKIIAASGLKKLSTLLAVIKGGMADILIIDQDLAQGLLNAYTS